MSVREPLERKNKRKGDRKREWQKQAVLCRGKIFRFISLENLVPIDQSQR